MSHDRPPRLGLALVRLFVNRERRLEAEGDLIELWRIRAAAGRWVRHVAFWKDVYSLAVAKPKPSRTAVSRRPHLRLTTSVWPGVRFTARLLSRQPLFGTLVIGTLAFGLSAAITIFTLCDRLLLRPLPYPDPARVVSIGGVGLGMANGHPAVPVALAQLPEYSSVGMYGSGGLNLGDDEVALRVRAAGVSAGLFGALGVPVLHGRVFDAEEELTEARVVVVGFDLWRTRLGAESLSAGRTIRLNGRAFNIIGVMPPGFTFPDDAQLWTPAFSDLQMYGAAYGPRYVGRLKRGVTLDQARAAVAAMDETLRIGRPGWTPRPADVISLQDRLVGGVRPTLLFLAVVVGLLLVATCANVTGLLLSRIRVREQELLIRQSLGAGRAQLAIQLLIESVMMTSLGGLIGLGMAAVAVRAITAAVPDLALQGPLQPIDARFTLLSLAVVLVTGALVGLAPALTVARRRTGSELRQDLTHTRRMGWVARGLVAGQVAAALVLLTATAAALSVIRRTSQIDLGFDNDRAAVFELTLPRTRYATARAISQVAHAIEQAVDSTPGVEAAGLSTLAPDSHDMAAGVLMAREGETIDLSSSARSATLLAATPGYFRTMGIGVVAGRSFADADDVSSARVVVLSEQAARTLWASPRAAIGQRALIASVLSPAPQLFDVIGVVRDVHLRGVALSEMQAYFPFAVAPPYAGLTVAFSASKDVGSYWPAVQRQIDAIDPDLPIYNRLLIRDVRGRFLARQRLTLELTSLFGGVALALCAIGLYGVLAQMVAQRTREIGIRLALGERPQRLLGGVVASGLGATVLGLAVGAVGSGAAMRLTARFVPDLVAPSVAAIGTAGLLLFAASILGAWRPAYRASRVDPLAALRAD